MVAPKTCNYYSTLRCNDQCEFCSIWPDEINQQFEERPIDLLGLKRRGIKRLNITGGEPLLREDLPDILKTAKQLGIFTELTTNGLLYADRARSIGGKVDRLLVALDYPIASEHDRSRGVECFHLAISAIERAKAIGGQPLIKFTMTRDSVRYLPEMVELAEKINVFIELEPVSDFHGTQGFEAMTIEHIKYFSRRKNVLVNLAALEFIKAGGNNVLLPRCRAQETTITVLPDGREAAPCFYNRGGKQGKEAVCSSCMRWPYMLPSFANGFDKYFWLNLYSEGVRRYKEAKQ